TWILEYREEREQQQNDDHPQGEVSQISVHLCLPGARLGLRNSANSARRFRDGTHYRSQYVGTMPAYAKRKGKILKKCGSFTILPLSACGGALNHDPIAGERDHCPGKRAAKPRRTSRSRQGRHESFELAQFDRAFIAHVGNGTAHEA